MNRCYTFLSLLCLLSVSLSAQTKKIKWGDIPMEYLQMKTYDKDTSAGAVILLDYGVYTFTDDYKPDLYIHQRIKILKTSGYDAANVSVTYRFSGSSEKITYVKAVSYNLLPDGKVEETKLEGNMIFDEDIDGTWHRRKFTVPNVKVGTVIEYQYIKGSSNAYYGPGWYFQSTYPVLHSQLEASIPTGIEYVFITKDPNRYVNLSSEPYQQEMRSQGIIKNVIGTKGTWTANNVPAFKEEEYMTTMDDYITKVTFQLSKIYLPGMLPQDVMNTWESLNKELFDDFYTGRQISGKGPINDKADSLVAGVTDPVKKMQIIYNWVRDNMVYTEKTNLYSTNDLNRVFKQRRGDLGDFALLLTLMFRNASLNANLILTSTWENGYPQKIYPLTKQFNYLITMVEIDNNQYFLDATNPNRPWNLLPVRVTDRPGLVIQKEAMRWVEIPALGKRKKTIRTIADFDKDGHLSGTITIADDGYSALRIRSDYKKSEDDKQLIDLYDFKKNPDLKIELTGAKNINNTDAVLSSTYNFTYETGFSGEEIIYFDPILVKLMEENPFKAESRTYPVDFGYVTQLTYVSDYTLPENFSVEELPKNLVMKLPENTGEFKRIIKAEDNKISMIITLTINQSHFEPAYYAHLREFFDKFVSINNDQIVLKRKS